MIEFSVTDWTAWAPALESREDWLRWSAAPWLPHGEQVPALPEVPALQRRRIERLGRTALQAVLRCDLAAGAPMIFASRHGDVARSLGLLQMLADDQPLSPTGFSMSVHNATAAQHSIIKASRGNYLALAAGDATVEAACVEAAALLMDGAPAVHVVMYDAPLPGAYAPFADGAGEAFYAWCWRVVNPQLHAQARLRLSWRRGTGDAPAFSLLPAGLEAHRFLLSGQDRCDRLVEGGIWSWQRSG